MNSNFLEKINSKYGFIKNNEPKKIINENENLDKSDLNEKLFYIPSNIKDEDILKIEDNKLFLKDGNMFNLKKINKHDLIRKY